MMWWNWGSSWVTMWLLMGVSLGGLALLIVLALQTEPASQNRRPIDPSVTDPREVLALRFARGDIDVNEYLNRMNALSEAVRDA